MRSQEPYFFFADFFAGLAAASLAFVAAAACAAARAAIALTFGLPVGMRGMGCPVDVG